MAREQMMARKKQMVDCLEPYKEQANPREQFLKKYGSRLFCFLQQGLNLWMRVGKQPGGGNFALGDGGHFLLAGSGQDAGRYGAVPSHRAAYGEILMGATPSRGPGRPPWRSRTRETAGAWRSRAS